jgi:hypothetical protein
MYQWFGSLESVQDVRRQALVAKSAILMLGPIWSSEVRKALATEVRSNFIRIDMSDMNYRLFYHGQKSLRHGVMYVPMRCVRAILTPDTPDPENKFS